jgi:hypothetical protein
VPYDPRFLEMPRWAALTSALVASLGPLPYIVADIERFHTWADAFRSMTDLAPYNLPDSRSFGDWRRWAMAANMALFSLGV